LTENDKPVRLDKWLWAARFYKTRAVAAAAVAGGKVQLNGARVKPAKPVKTGDRLLVHTGPYEWAVTVEAVSEKRGPASDAQKLYTESEQSRLAREEMALQRKTERLAAPTFAKGRPSKRDRRRIIKFTQDNN
jgi:ribosome-associated heat shock protein Hsp15